jgi:hypothetical protein
VISITFGKKYSFKNRTSRTEKKGINSQSKLVKKDSLRNNTSKPKLTTVLPETTKEKRIKRFISKNIEHFKSSAL